MEYMSDYGTHLKNIALTLEKGDPLAMMLYAAVSQLGGIEIGYLTRLAKLGDEKARQELIRRNGGVWLQPGQTPIEMLKYALADMEGLIERLALDEEDDPIVYKTLSEIRSYLKGVS